MKELRPADAIYSSFGVGAFQYHQDELYYAPNEIVHNAATSTLSQVPCCKKQMDYSNENDDERSADAPSQKSHSVQSKIPSEVGDMRYSLSHGERRAGQLTH